MSDAPIELQEHRLTVTREAVRTGAAVYPTAAITGVRKFTRAPGSGPLVAALGLVGSAVLGILGIAFAVSGGTVRLVSPGIGVAVALVLAAVGVHSHLHRAGAHHVVAIVTGAGHVRVLDTPDPEIAEQVRAAIERAIAG